MLPWVLLACAVALALLARAVAATIPPRACTLCGAHLAKSPIDVDVCCVCLSDKEPAESGARR